MLDMSRLNSWEVGESHESWYHFLVPHHLVEHNGKHCLVFNCSYQYQGENLNAYLLPGPTLGPSLIGVLIYFREHQVAISGDIKGMFHQIRLPPTDRPLLRFLLRSMKRDMPLKFMNDKSCLLALRAVHVVPYMRSKGMLRVLLQNILIFRLQS